MLEPLDAGNSSMRGTIIDNPNSDWAITDSTRDMIRTAISDGLAANVGRDGIITSIEALTGFSSQRADMIAETEIARVNSQAALQTYRAAGDVGVIVKKEWLIAAANVCDECRANADEGAIDLDQNFSSGDDTPPAHPGCRCSVAPVVQDEPATTDATLELADA